MKIGAVLAEERQRQGKTVQDIENATNIRKQFIEAIEAERFESLPDSYGAFFIRDYASQLGIDPDSILKDLQVESKENTSVPIVLSSFEPKEKRGAKHILGIVFSVLFLFFVIGIVNWNWPERPRKETETPSKVAVAHQSEGKSKSKPVIRNDATTARAAGDRERVLRVREAPKFVLLKVWVNQEPSWAQIRTNEQTIYEGTLPPGSYNEWSDQNKIDIKVGNAGAVRVQVNEKDLGVLGEFGQVVRRSFTPETVM